MLERIFLVSLIEKLKNSKRMVSGFEILNIMEHKREMLASEREDNHQMEGAFINYKCCPLIHRVKRGL